MTNDEISRYEALLAKRMQENETRFADLEEACQPVAPDQAIGRLTRNDAMQDQQVALHLRRQLELQRTRLDTALDRIRSGKFGICVMCNEPINAKRLDVVPESPLCVPCLDKRSKAGNR